MTCMYGQMKFQTCIDAGATKHKGHSGACSMTGDTLLISLALMYAINGDQINDREANYGHPPLVKLNGKLECCGSPESRCFRSAWALAALIASLSHQPIRHSMLTRCIWVCEREVRMFGAYSSFTISSIAELPVHYGISYPYWPILPLPSPEIHRGSS
ncbi:hypothetical protein CISG_05134 [Coccidioides immitis RMSCC 3703]|uniref:Uncharacterized protein n=1 Tax=Coccidioides immitis RMSCC 3703 TaxID=454286 RepID=A0A0J8QSP4_COCIT|nr:hypothetical protein CISG_05134 [Coccidioides immitis RMSCC 3703]